MRIHAHAHAVQYMQSESHAHPRQGYSTYYEDLTPPACPLAASPRRASPSRAALPAAHLAEEEVHDDDLTSTSRAAAVSSTASRPALIGRSVTQLLLAASETAKRIDTSSARG